MIAGGKVRQEREGRASSPCFVTMWCSVSKLPALSEKASCTHSTCNIQQ